MGKCVSKLAGCVRRCSKCIQVLSILGMNIDPQLLYGGDCVVASHCLDKVAERFAGILTLYSHLVGFQHV